MTSDLAVKFLVAAPTYYEAAGFVHRGDATVAGAPGQRLDEGPVIVVSRYERRLGPVS